VRFLSADSEDPSKFSYGYGAHIHVVDDRTAHGHVELFDVEFKNMGKINR
jgi:hypothetical protein